jgi:hypothetical protein
MEKLYLPVEERQSHKVECDLDVQTGDMPIAIHLYFNINTKLEENLIRRIRNEATWLFQKALNNWVQESNIKE